MAYNSANLNLMAGGFAGGPRLWHYNAGGDASTVVRVAGFFTDGYKKGMRAGDILYSVTSSFALSIHVVNASTLGALGANDTVDITDGTVIAATDTD